MNCKACKVCNFPLAAKDHYMLKDSVWCDEARFSKLDVAHLPCLEKHIGRELEAKDFINAVINYCGAVEQHKLPPKDFSYLHRHDDQKIRELLKNCVY